MTQDDPQDWRTRLTALICHPTSPRVLLVPHGDAWELPQWEAAARHWFKDTTEVTRGLREHLGLDAFVLRYVDRRDDEASHLVTAYCVVEPRSSEWHSPSDARWIDRSDIASVHFAQPEQREVIARCLEELAGIGVPPQRNDYAVPGWFAEAERWMIARLTDTGRPPLAPVEQFKTWGISCVLRAATAAGDVYLKAPSRYFAQEATLTPLLAQWFPDRTVTVLAADAQRAWLLLEDVGPPLYSQSDPALRDRTVTVLAEMQRACIDRTDALLAAGALDRRLAPLRELITSLTEAPELHADAPPELMQRLAQSMPHLLALRDELFAPGIPVTLIHGDLHGGNIGVRDGQIRIFDWTDLAVSHPFLDAVTLLPAPGRQVDERGDAHDRLRDRYLSGFAGIASPEQLRRAFDLAWCLGAAYQATSYVGILRSLEPTSRTEFDGALTAWLRRALDRADALSQGVTSASH